MQIKDQILKIVDLKEAFNAAKIHEAAVAYPMLEELLNYCFILTQKCDKDDEFYNFVAFTAQEINYEMEKIAHMLDSTYTRQNTI